MAENLLSNNAGAEFANQIFLQEDDDVNGGLDGIPMSVSSTHFSNPVYESMYRNEVEANEDEDDGGVTAGLLADPAHNHEHHHGGHHSEHHLIEELHQDDEESVDLLTEKHRGNISLWGCELIKKKLILIPWYDDKHEKKINM